MLSSDERLLSQDESENHGATLPPLGEMFRLESDASVQVLESHSAPPPPPPTLVPLYTTPGTRQGAPRGGGRYIYTLRQEKGQVG